MLEAGLTLGQAMKQQAKKGALAVRPVAARMAPRLIKGEDYKTVLKDEEDRFPPLFLAVGNVAEETGNLPEVLRELEEYFELQLSLWKQFLAQIAWPMIQLVLAVIVLTLFIWILGIIEGIVGPSPISFLGLKGEKGAMIFLGSFIGIVVVLVGGYIFVRNVLQRGETIDKLLLGIPLLGSTLRHFALSRFSMGLSLALEAGVPIREAARLSLRASSNKAFEAAIPKVQQALSAGVTFTEALRETCLFPESYMLSIENAEFVGKEPEVLQRLAKNHYEDGARGLKGITRAASFGVWLLVATLIIVCIFSIVMQLVSYREGVMKDLGVG
jgi:type II secretory pathway component PulF